MYAVVDDPIGHIPGFDIKDILIFAEDEKHTAEAAADLLNKKYNTTDYKVVTIEITDSNGRKLWI